MPRKKTHAYPPPRQDIISGENFLGAYICKEQLEMFKLICDSVHDGIVVTDADGFIVIFNKPYSKFLGIDQKDAIGRHCTEIFENTRMHIVAQTGKPEFFRPHLMKGQQIIAQRIPIKRNGNVVAVYGQVMFKNVRDVVRLAKKHSLLESKVKVYEQELINLRSTKYTFDSIITASDAIRSLKQEALAATGNDYPVLITGESGTGKELFAQAIHQASHRKMYPFIHLNCSAIPRDLLEAELFGYEQGAFTGAKATGKLGKFELADRGTIFLDEIGDLPIEMQPKLLRVLEGKEFERIGGNQVIRSDFRLIAATNRDLKNMIAEDRFRHDLFYRINVIPLHVPPLRERRDDILALSEHFLKNMADEAKMDEITLDAEAEKLLWNYDWPGNVRELVNILERTLSRLEGKTICVEDLPFYLRRREAHIEIPTKSSLRDILNQVEEKTIRQTLSETNYNKALAAKKLKIHRTILYQKMKKYKIPLS